MRYLLILPLLYLAAVLQTSLGDLVAIGRISPDLLALTAVICLLVVSNQRAFLMAGMIGLFCDLISPGRLGLGMACFLLAGYAVSRLRSKIASDHLVVQVAMLLAAIALLESGLATGQWLLGETQVPLTSALLCALGVAFYTTGVSVPLLMVIGWIREPFTTRHAKLVEL